MTVIQFVAFAAIYLVSFAGLIIYADIGQTRKKLTFDEYQQTFYVALIPVVNTIGLLLCLASALTHWLSFGIWSEKTKI